MEIWYIWRPSRQISSPKKSPKGRSRINCWSLVKISSTKAGVPTVLLQYSSIATCASRMAGCSWPEKMPSRNAFRGLFVVLRESIWSHFGIDAVGVYPLQAGHEGQPSSNDGPAFYGMIHELGKNLSLSHFFWWWVLLGFYYPTMIVCFYIIAKNYTYICIYIYT